MRMLISAARIAAVALVCAIGVSVASPQIAEAASTGCLPGSVKAKLAQIRSKFGPVRVVSTHRRGARIAGTGKRSYHASCRAVDFHPPRGKYRQVLAYLRANHSGGLGTYSCGMHHIHLDNGPRVRFHHCVNAKGRPVGKKRKYASRKSYKKRAYYKKSRKYGKKRYSKKRYGKKRYSKKRYTKKRYGKKRYGKKRYSKKRYTKKRYSKKSYKKRYSYKSGKAKKS